MSATAFQRKRREESAKREKSEAQQESDYSDLTNDQLKELLDTKGIEYKARANKNELIELLTGTV